MPTESRSSLPIPELPSSTPPVPGAELVAPPICAKTTNNTTNTSSPTVAPSNKLVIILLSVIAFLLLSMIVGGGVLFYYLSNMNRTEAVAATADSASEAEKAAAAEAEKAAAAKKASEAEKVAAVTAEQLADAKEKGVAEAEVRAAQRQTALADVIVQSSGMPDGWDSCKDTNEYRAVQEKKAVLDYLIRRIREHKAKADTLFDQLQAPETDPQEYPKIADQARKIADDLQQISQQYSSQKEDFDRARNVLVEKIIAVRASQQASKTAQTVAVPKPEPPKPDPKAEQARLEKERLERERQQAEALRQKTEAEKRQAELQKQQAEAQRLAKEKADRERAEREAAEAKRREAEEQKRLAVYRENRKASLTLSIPSKPGELTQLGPIASVELAPMNIDGKKYRYKDGQIQFNDPTAGWIPMSTVTVQGDRLDIRPNADFDKRETAEAERQGLYKNCFMELAFDDGQKCIAQLGGNRKPAEEDVARLVPFEWDSANVERGAVLGGKATFDRPFDNDFVCEVELDLQKNSCPGVVKFEDDPDSGSVVFTVARTDGIEDTVEVVRKVNVINNKVIAVYFDGQWPVYGGQIAKDQQELDELRKQVDELQSRIQDRQTDAVTREKLQVDLENLNNKKVSVEAGVTGSKLMARSALDSARFDYRVYLRAKKGGVNRLLIYDSRTGKK